MFSVCSFSRPGRLGLTRRMSTMGSRAHPPAPKVITATSHTTRATAKREKMCETLHKKTSADRGDPPQFPTSTPPQIPTPIPSPPSSLSATDWQSCPTSVARLQQYLSHCQASRDDKQQFLAGKKKKKKKRNRYRKWGLICWTWTAITKDKCSFASEQVLLQGGFPSLSQHLHNKPAAPPAVQE